MIEVFVPEAVANLDDGAWLADDSREAMSCVKHV